MNGYLSPRTYPFAGEAKRVALGRALSATPGILCLDEPLSALDHETRQDMCDLLRRIKQETGVTTLHITHNRAETELLADQLLRFEDGEVVSPDAVESCSHDR